MPDNAVLQNKLAWEHQVYEWRVNQGTPQFIVDEVVNGQRKHLRYHANYFNKVEGKRIASVCGSNGLRALELALLKAEATVFDISEPQKKYALELAEAAGVKIDYEVGNFCEADITKYGKYFDYAYAEGGILHYFHDLHKFFTTINKILKKSGTLILCDFHPFTKIAPANFNLSESHELSDIDYFDSSVQQEAVVSKQDFPENEQDAFPSVLVRRYTLSEIINAVIQAGFNIREFNEHPGWVNQKRPGEFTITARKRG